MNMNRDVAYKPGVRNGRRGSWIKSNFGAGLCFTVGYDDLERILQRTMQLKETEQIERVEINGSGITVFIEPKVIQKGEK